MDSSKDMPSSLSFDDVLVAPGYSEVLPSECDVSTRLTAEIRLNIPLLSAAMDTVTEADTAISLAREGGIGIVHRNLAPEAQAREVLKVKKVQSGIVVDPVTIHPDQTVREALELMSRHAFSGLPVVKEDRLVGILTNRDLRFERNLEARVRDVMTTELITVKEGVDPETCKELLHRNRIEKLLVVDDAGRLKGLITIRDIQAAERNPLAVKDSMGRLRVGAALGTGPDTDERAERLVAVGVDVLCLDTAHGHSRKVIEVLRRLRSAYPEAQIIAGNVGTKEGFAALVEAGASAVKVGIGPGSICTTRIVSGVGVPQMTAVLECAEVSRRTGVPLVADGGIKYSGDLVKALVGGAHTVMIGSLFAGTDEAPGEIILYQGRSYKVYRGMGSIGAMRAGSADRYFQGGQEESKLVPEGIEGRVPYKGSLSRSVYQLVGGIKSGMGYTGSRTIEELHEKARLLRITAQGLRESHVHDVIITKEAPNYRLE
ncbi:MAG: IMP dehydrogenase [Polyangia bacterium]|jgi:IMP dehydrogenase|nr:IMP dehydrogenase [Polyangia bacterium]